MKRANGSSEVRSATSCSAFTSGTSAQARLSGGLQPVHLDKLPAVYHRHRRCFVSQLRRITR
jgi:hypothetical protein